MERFTWSDSLSTGVVMIDTHHKELIAAINDLAIAIENGQGGSAIKKLLVFLQYYAEWHFDHEEKCAAKHHCPMADVNKQAHTKFLETVTNLNVSYRESGGSEGIARQIHQELSDWLRSHILKIDTQLGECIRAATN
jgi:hemerythrin